MTIQSTLALIFTVITSVFLVASIILLGWFLIWKAFLSKFRLIRELLGQEEENILIQQQQQAPAENNQTERQQPQSKTKKVRKED